MQRNSSKDAFKIEIIEIAIEIDADQKWQTRLKIQKQTNV